MPILSRIADQRYANPFVSMVFQALAAVGATPVLQSRESMY